MIDGADFLKWCEIFRVNFGGDGGPVDLQEAYNNGNGSILETGTKPFVLKTVTATGDNSSILETFSITKGSRPFPSMTTAQRNAIVSPANGLMIFNTDTGQINYYNNLTISWIAVDAASGGFLEIANNLSDVADTQTAFTNLGLGSGQLLNLVTFDFPGGVYTLTNPCPKYINVSSNIVGDVILKLPPAQGDQAFSLSQGPTICFDKVIPSFGNLILQLSDGTLFYEDLRGNPYCLNTFISDNSTVPGTWSSIPFVDAFIGIDEDGIIDGYIGNVYVNTNIIPVSSNFTPLNFSPVPDDGVYASSSITAFLAGIDQALGTSGGSLQNSYDSGSSAEINLSSSRPIKINNITSASDVNAVTTPSTGTNTVNNYRVLGWVFNVSTTRNITALQYQDSNFSSGVRTVGVYVKSTGELLGSIDVAKTDPLVGPYRTATLPEPIQLIFGIDYVIATVVPANEANNLNSDAVPAAGITITERCVGTVSLFPIPLSFPTSFTVDPNNTPAGFFEYAITTVIDSVQFLDETTSATTIFEIQSTIRSSIPIPPMTAAQRDAIGVTNFGSWVYVNDVNPRRPYAYDGTDWQGIAYLSDLPTIPSLSQGQLIIGVDSSNPLAGYITSSDSSVNIDISVNGAIDLSVNSTSGDTLQDAYNAGNTIEVDSGRPLLIESNSLGTLTNGVTTSSTGINNSSNYQILGYTFLTSVNVFITTFQVEDSTLGVGQVRTLAIYEKSTGIQIAIGTVSKTDSLVGAYRTNALSSPVLLTGGIDYVLTAIVPPAQIYRSVANAVPGAEITISEFATGDSQAFPIPMSFPTSFTATANVTPYGAFQYQVNNVVSTFLVHNESSSFFMQAKSTTQATIPNPVMLDSEWTAIASPEQGMMAFIMDASPSPRLATFDGANYHTFSYLDDNNSGAGAVIIANVSGTTGLSLIKSMWQTPVVGVGYTCTVSLEFSYTATATTQVISIDVPVIAANNFSNANQATLMGGSVYVNGSPAIGDGALLDVVADVGFTRVQLGVLTANTTGTKVVSVSFMYVIQ